ncbi:MAG: MFS transporter [Anaerolineales bacterium]|nr:MFS transporter [Anaerolineales bacterium]
MENKTVQQSSPVVPAYAWVILAIVFLASVCAPLNQNKVPPLMPILMDAFQLNLSQAGSLMSVFAITGLILSLPAGFILQRLGPKISGLIALSSLGFGAVMGAFAHNLAFLLAGRVIEGIGMGLIAVVAPATIAMWFPPEKQGIPMGLWATWVPLGNVTMLLVAPALATAFGWQSVWWVGAGVTLVILVLYGFLVRVPPVKAEDLEQQHFHLQFKALINRDVWLLGFMFACTTFTFMGINTFYPTYLSEVRGYNLQQASQIASISTGLVLISAPLAGWLSDKVGSRKLFFTFPYLILALMMLLPFNITGWQIYAYLIVLGCLAGAVPTATFAAAPEVIGDPRLSGLALGIVMFGQNLGMVIGPLVFGGLVEKLGWAQAGYLLIPVLLLGFILGRMVNIR